MEIDPKDIKNKDEVALTGDEQIHQEAMQRFDDIMNRELENRELGVEDARFAQTQDGMWNDDYEEEGQTVARRDRRDDVPKFTFNLVASAIDTVIGDQRQNEISIRVRPDGDGAEQEDADVFNGLIKHILNNSGFNAINDNAFDETLNSGYGGFRVVTRFTHDDVNRNAFDQEIVIEPINSAVTSLFFGPAKKYDKSDALYAFLTWKENTHTFKALYPDAQVADFQAPQYSSGLFERWFDGDTVRLAEYWRKVPTKRKIGLLSDGRVVDLNDEKKVLDELRDTGIEVVRERTIDAWQIERYIMNGVEILKPKQAWAGSIIPLIPQFGKINHIDGREYIRGLVRFAKDPQRVYNWLRTSIVSVMSKLPKDPYWYTPKQVMGHEAKWEEFNINDDPFLPFNPDKENPGPPKRSGTPQLQPQMVEAAQTARLDVQAATGVTPGTAQPAAGTEIDRRSGKAIEAQQRRGDIGAYSFMSNHALTQQALGNCLVDLIPRIYDSTRQVTILQEDGEAEQLTLNQTVLDSQTGENVIVNDLSKGRYSVTVDIGPAFTTQRMEAADRLIALSSDPDSVFAKVTPDIIADNLDLPHSAAEPLRKRLRMQMIQQGIAEPTEEEAEQLQPTEAQIAQDRLARRREEAEIRLLESEASNAAGEAEKRLAETDNKDFDSNRKAVEAWKDTLDGLMGKAERGIPITLQDLDLLAGQADMVEQSVQNIQPGPNSNQQDILPPNGRRLMQ